MDVRTLFVAALCAAGFVAWPIIGNYSKASGAWVGIVVFIGTAIVVTSLSVNQLNHDSSPTARAMALLVAAGIINGMATYFFASKITDPAISVSVFMVTVSVGMVIFAPIFNFATNDVVPTLRQSVGFSFAAVAIYLLSK